MAPRRTLASLYMLAFVTGCPRTPPIDPRKDTANAPLSGRLDADLDDTASGYARSFRVDLPARGALLVEARAVEPVDLDVDVYLGGASPVATTGERPEKRLEAVGLPVGPAWVVVRQDWGKRRRTHVVLSLAFRPDEPDLNNRRATRPGASELRADGGSGTGRVDYSALQRTNLWIVRVPLAGELALRFAAQAAGVAAELVPPQGSAEPIDREAGLRKQVPAGEYLVRVQARAPGDVAAYEVSSSFTPGDLCADAPPACRAESAEVATLPSDNRAGEVDYSRNRHAHWVVVPVRRRGTLSITFRTSAVRGAGASAALIAPGEEPVPIDTSSPLRRAVVKKGDYRIRISAASPGDAARFALVTEFVENEVTRRPVAEYGQDCLYVVPAGSRNGVQPDAACSLVDASGTAIAECAIVGVFSNNTKVRPVAADCGRLPRSGLTVELTK
jgi:hypothetical protein